MPISVPKPRELIDSFPEVPQPIAGQPTYKNLKSLCQAIKTNAASVDTIFGGGMNGHLGLVVPPNVYNMVVPPPNPHVNAWVDPVHPGLVPAYPPNATDIQKETIREAHNSLAKVLVYNRLDLKALPLRWPACETLM